MMRVLITGGTGSLGRALVAEFLADPSVVRVKILSRDEWKQAELATQHPDPRLECLLGDVRDEARLRDAFRGMDTVIHAAALKRVDKVAADPDEALLTNVLGTRHVCRAARETGVGRVVVVSSDKAVMPTNFYGGTKFLAEQIAIRSNVYGYPRGTRVSVVRYGNVLGSRGSVLSHWRAQAAAGGPLTVTDPHCTRFVITMPQAVALIRVALDTMAGGEVFVPMLPAAALMDLASAVLTEVTPWQDTGLRPGGEKTHEQLLTDEEVWRTLAVPAPTLPGGQVYVVTPSLPTWTAPGWAGTPLPAGTVYRSDVSAWRVGPEELRTLLTGGT